MMTEIEALEYNVEHGEDGREGTIVLNNNEDLKRFYKLVQDNTNFILRIDGDNNRLIIPDSIKADIDNGDIVLESNE